jgi:hypothetical protein
MDKSQRGPGGTQVVPAASFQRPLGPPLLGRVRKRQGQLFRSRPPVT